MQNPQAAAGRQPPPIEVGVLRMIDANANRAAEGWRTLEDLARFVMDDPYACGHFKSLRHSLIQVITDAAGPQRWVARDSAGDVGTAVKAPDETRRAQLSDVAAAAAARVEQSLRCIEECFKLHSAPAAAAVERLRYQAYDLHAAVLTRLQRDGEFLRRAKLYVLADCRLPIDAFAARVERIAAAGVDLVQIRDKAADAVVILQYAAAAAGVLDPARTRLIVNDRVDLAAIAAVSGVHLGQEDLGVRDARRMLPVERWIGVSTHNPEQLDLAVAEAADYVGCGPTFTSQTKSFERFAGLEYLRHVAQHCPLPAFAIGGVTRENIDRVIEAGVRRVAVSQAVWSAPDPFAAAATLRESLDRPGLG